MITITHSQANKANELYKAKIPASFNGVKNPHTLNRKRSTSSPAFEQSSQESINYADYIRISKNYSPKIK